MCRMFGAWNLERMIADHCALLCRSIRILPNESVPQLWDDLTFQFGPRSFVYADACRVVGFASTPTEAERLVTQFSKAYLKPPQPRAGEFSLIQVSGNDINTHEVPLPTEISLRTEALDLHYGDGAEAWHQEFVTKFRENPHGLSIFEGSPGTGKTSYLRYLMDVLKESHRFYFIPTASMDVLSKPEFIGFRAGQRRLYDDKRFVVILEDSEAALITRSTDNRDQVSALLNLSDGMLVDFLQLHIICTINCTTANLDPALLRPGRLLCHRIFPRLDYAQAARLAESLGQKLPVAADYSLAEIFAGQDIHETNRMHIGFR